MSILQSIDEFRVPIAARVREVLKPHNITEQQWRILSCLYDQSLMSKDISAKTSLLREAVSRCASGLEERGLIFMEESSHDWRGVDHSLTPHAHKLMTKLCGAVNDALKLTPDDLQRLKEIRC